MSPFRWLWLGLAVWGAVHPWMRLGEWLGGNAGGLSGLIAVWLENDATRGLLASLIVASVTLSCFILAETVVRKNWIALAALPVTLVLGVGCGLPLYLFLRAAPVR